MLQTTIKVVALWYNLNAQANLIPFLLSAIEAAIFAVTLLNLSSRSSLLL